MGDLAHPHNPMAPPTAAPVLARLQLDHLRAIVAELDRHMGWALGSYVALKNHF
ncbi:MAG: hypothetical protein HYZ12_00995 [Thaumarchaeota archaeon]|nr:hypothetical protein [Nitrososphaerota archaeon]